MAKITAREYLDRLLINADDINDCEPQIRVDVMRVAELLLDRGIDLSDPDVAAIVLCTASLVHNSIRIVRDPWRAVSEAAVIIGAVVTAQRGVRGVNKKDGV